MDSSSQKPLQFKAFPRDSESNERSKSRSTKGRGREFELCRTWKRSKAKGFSGALAMSPSSALGVLALAFCLALPNDVMASTSSLPWDGPIEKIANGLQGPVAFLFALGGMIVLGVRWIFGGELGTMTRALLTTIAGIALLVFAAGFLAQLFGVASVISATSV